MNTEDAITIRSAVLIYDDYALGKSLVQSLLADINSEPASASNTPAPMLDLDSRRLNIIDAVSLAKQRYELYRKHHPLFGSKDRSEYRRALLGLWAVLHHYENQKVKR